MNYAITRWLEENQVAIDRGIKNELNEELINGFLNVLSSNHVNIPDDKIDVVEGMAETIREMEDRLNEQVKSNIEISKQLSEVKGIVILNQVSEGLADTQKEKLAALAEGVEFKSDADYLKKLTTIRESYFKSDSVRSTVDENPIEISEDLSPAMAAYAKALSNWNV